MREIIRENLNSKLQDVIQKYLNKNFTIHVMECAKDPWEPNKKMIDMHLFLESEEENEDFTDFESSIDPNHIVNDDYLSVAKKFGQLFLFLTDTITTQMGLTDTDSSIVESCVIQFIADQIKEEFIGGKNMKPWFIKNFVK